MDHVQLELEVEDLQVIVNVLADENEMLKEKLAKEEARCSVLTRDLGLYHQLNWGRQPAKAEVEMYLPATGQEMMETQPDLYLGETGSLQVQIFVKNLTGKTVTLEVGSEDTIQSVKEQLFEKDGVPVDLQKLVFLGQQMDPEKKVKDYGIQRGSTVHLLISGRGGMQNPDPHILVLVPSSSGTEGGALESVDPMVVDPPILELTAPKIGRASCRERV